MTEVKITITAEDRATAIYGYYLSEERLSASVPVSSCVLFSGCLRNRRLAIRNEMTKRPEPYIGYDFKMLSENKINNMTATASSHLNCLNNQGRSVSICWLFLKGVKRMRLARRSEIMRRPEPYRGWDSMIPSEKMNNMTMAMVSSHLNSSKGFFIEVLRLKWIRLRSRTEMISSPIAASV